MFSGVYFVSSSLLPLASPNLGFVAVRAVLFRSSAIQLEKGESSYKEVRKFSQQV